MAGSVMAVGVGAPAFADTVSTDNMSTMPTSINGGVEQALNEQPLQKAADSAQVDSTLNTLTQATEHLRGDTSADALLGQASTATQGVAKSGLGGAVPGASLLGGLPLGSLPLAGVLGGLGG
ncbi:hypothetical protein [Actinacidiphila bryophytorum]|uniref:hypothetical protein n=1 Tax=Actinacidiphila bryophytorum TaxID=1436133 RepID=UPI0019610491|nr:hypothetical protein [Actinacidiphila bryophytorum]MBM9435714.1 hypothetical protein [Actinacidiphila bryophytorum]MBN6543892.1 hypothetical protein [Actinacidiphila bryophytorum]